MAIGIGVRCVAGIALLSACGAAPVTSVAGVSPVAQSSTLPPLWRDVAIVRILCLVTTDRGVDDGMLHDRICASARRFAAAGAPVPVEVISPGDPKVLAADSVTLLIHASVQPHADGRLVALAIRPYRASDPGAQLFGAAPRALLVSAAQLERGATDSAIEAMLAETIPWLSRAPAHAPIHNR